jgi:branched-subunit amino acid transport protein
MMSVWGLLALAAITYGSRALALAILPVPSQRVQHLLERVPPPLFASLAALSLFDEHNVLASAPTLGALIGALVAAPFRSLPASLFGGAIGYLAGTLLG